MKKIKFKNGISLIVLVITIIIMIIISGAIILSLNSAGIIERAHKAKSDNDLSSKKQAANVALAEYNLLINSNDNSVQNKTATEYVKQKLESQNIESNNVTVLNGRVIVGSGASAINQEVSIGDFVNYTPTSKTSSKYKIWDRSTWKNTDTYFSTQTGEQALSWRYMGIDNEGNALLVSDRSTDGLLFFIGKDGYLQGINNLNDLCNELYSSSFGTSRSINEDDITSLLNKPIIGRYYYNGWIMNNDNLTIGEIISKNSEIELTSTNTPENGKSINSYIANYTDESGTNYIEENTKEYKLIFRNGDDSSNIEYVVAEHVAWLNGRRCSIWIKTHWKWQNWVDGII